MTRYVRVCVGKQKLLAGLLLFRLLYYVVPFVLSLLILGGRELAPGPAGALRRACRAPADRPAAGPDRRRGHRQPAGYGSAAAETIAAADAKPL